MPMIQTPSSPLTSHDKITFIFEVISMSIILSRRFNLFNRQYQQPDNAALKVKMIAFVLTGQGLG